MTNHVLYVVAEPIPFGPSEQAAVIAGALGPDFTVDQVCLAESVRPPHAGIETCSRTYFARPGNVLGSAFWLRRAICAKKYAVVHSWERRASELLRWVLPTIRPPDRPKLWLAHLGDDVPSRSLLPIPGLLRPDTMTADKSVALQNTSASLIGITPAATAPVAGPKVLRDAAGVRPQTILVGSACSLQARSGLRHLIWSLDQLKCLGRDVRLVVWGHGPDEVALRRYARLTLIDDWILWRDPRGNVAGEMAELDFYWHAPHSQSTPGALIAALLHGIPSIAPQSASTDALARHWPSLLRTVPRGDRADYTRHTVGWLDRGKPSADPAVAQRFLAESGPAAAAAELAELYRRHLTSA